MYSRKKIPAPFGKPQKTAEKKKEATTAFSQKETSKEPIFLHAEEKTMPQGGGSPVLAMLLLELLFLPSSARLLLQESSLSGRGARL